MRIRIGASYLRFRSDIQAEHASQERLWPRAAVGAGVALTAANLFIIPSLDIEPFLNDSLQPQVATVELRGRHHDYFIVLSELASQAWPKARQASRQC